MVKIRLYIKMSQQVAAAIASPVVSAPSAYVAAPQAQPKNSNTIVLAIILIAIVVFCIFLFTKLNTVNKEVKELKTDRDAMAKQLKLLEAIAERVGIRQNEQGEIEQLTDETEEDGDADGEDDECDDGECLKSCGTEDGKCAVPREHQFHPSVFGPLFGGLATLNLSPGDVTVVPGTRATAPTVVEEQVEPAQPKETDKVD